MNCHWLKIGIYYLRVDRIHIGDTRVVTDFDVKRIGIRVINTDINNKFKYYGVSIIE